MNWSIVVSDNCDSSDRERDGQRKVSVSRERRTEFSFLFAIRIDIFFALSRRFLLRVFVCLVHHRSE